MNKRQRKKRKKKELRRFLVSFKLLVDRPIRGNVYSAGSARTETLIGSWCDDFGVVHGVKALSLMPVIAPVDSVIPIDLGQVTVCGVKFWDPDSCYPDLLEADVDCMTCIAVDTEICLR